MYAPAVLDGVSSFEEMPPDASEMRRRIEEVGARYPWLVAVRDDVVAGYAYAAAHRTRPAYRWTADVSVYIAPGHHRQGLGRALYTTLFALLRQQGLYVVCAGISLPNPGSVGLHTSLGFEPIGVYRDIGFKHGAWRSVGWWQRELGPRPEGQPPEPGPPARLPLRPPPESSAG